MSFKYHDLKKIYEKVKNMKQKGKNADYIPDLKIANPNIYGFSICNINGDIVNFGNYDTEVAIESVSKVFTLALALNMYNVDKLISHIDNKVEKHEFNSIKDVVQLKNHTVNSFVNAGAMATTSLLYDDTKSNESNEWKMKKGIVIEVLKKMVHTNPKERIDCVEALSMLDPFNNIIETYGRIWIEQRLKQRRKTV